MATGCSATIVVQAADKLGKNLGELIQSVSQTASSSDKSVEMAFKLMEMQSNAMQGHFASINSQITILSFGVGVAGVLLGVAGWFWQNGVKKSVEKQAIETARKTAEKKTKEFFDEWQGRKNLPKPGGLVEDSGNSSDDPKSF